MLQINLRILVRLVIYDSGQVSLEHLLISRHPSQNPESINHFKDFYLNVSAIIWPWLVSTNQGPDQDDLIQF